MKYTVIVPAYNAEETIGACLEALVEQEGVTLNRDYTIVLVNDGSTDATVDIAKQFPISVVNMAKNSGRIAARLAGARVAVTPLIMFVDSRVVMLRDVLAQMGDLPDNQCLMCLIVEPPMDELNWFNRSFQLIRSRYYTVNHEPGGIIDKSNFKRARKGTTAALFNRDTFIDINNRLGAGRISDDTLLFYHLVSDLNGTLRLSDKPLGRYLPRRQASRILPWLADRGGVFADFYLGKGNYYHNLFVMFLLLAFAGIFFAVYGYANIVFSLFFCIYLVACVYFSREPKDFIILMFVLPIICAVFGGGVFRYFWRAHKGRICGG